MIPLRSLKDMVLGVMSVSIVSNLCAEILGSRLVVFFAGAFKKSTLSVILRVLPVMLEEEFTEGSSLLATALPDSSDGVEMVAGVGGVGLSDFSLSESLGGNREDSFTLQDNPTD